MSDILGVNNPDDNPLLATGMTLRDFFAAHVMNGCVAAGESFNIDAVAGLSYEVADAMLKARQS